VVVTEKKLELVEELIDDIKKFRFCGPGDEVEEIFGVTAGYRDIVIRLQRIAGPLLPLIEQTRLNGIRVEMDNLYSAYDADSEVKALLPDIEAAIETERARLSPSQAHVKPLPAPLCSVVGNTLGNYIFHHKTLEGLFYGAGAAGDVPEGNCVTKCQSWLRRMHEDVPAPFSVLGKVLEEFMEVDSVGKAEEQETGRKRIQETLARFGLSYHQGGLVMGASTALPTKALQQILKERDLAGVDNEFARSLAHVETDPPAAITAACAILESLFKIYIEDHEALAIPGDQSVKPLWKTASKHLGLDPAAVEDEDIKKILSGMNSVVDGIGCLRTHTGTAHGRGGNHTYRIQARHARLAVHAAHTLVGFFLETWDERKRKGAQ
jgi:hypothetical protein